MSDRDRAAIKTDMMVVQDRLRFALGMMKAINKLCNESDDPARRPFAEQMARLSDQMRGIIRDLDNTP